MGGEGEREKEKEGERVKVEWGRDRGKERVRQEGDAGSLLGRRRTNAKWARDHMLTRVHSSILHSSI